MIIHDKLIGLANKERNKEPFDHWVLDGFFESNIAFGLERDFLGYEDPSWFFYDNAIEHKKALNNWGKFPSLTYRVFDELCSPKFVDALSRLVGVSLVADPGLHGGGWHIHGDGGNLNPHLDYSIHPKLRMQRKINIIIYLSSELQEHHGGHLGLWRHDESMNGPGELVKEVEPRFNRAVIFDTTQNSWHGMSRQLSQPKGVFRKSLAVYYLTEPADGASMRERALFAPRQAQSGDEGVRDLIRMRADSSSFATVYRQKSKKD